jgi:hypothetical protein
MSWLGRVQSTSWVSGAHKFRVFVRFGFSGSEVADWRKECGYGGSVAMLLMWRVVKGWLRGVVRCW